MPLITSPLFIFYNPKQRAMPSSKRLPCAFGANGRMLMLDVYPDGKRTQIASTKNCTNSCWGLFRTYCSDCVVDSQRDVKGPGRGESTYNAKEFLKTLRHLNLTDAWVHLHSDHFGPTRTSKTTASRIDRTYLPDYLLPSVVAWEVLVLPNNLAGKSEHLPLVTTVRGCPGPRNCNLSWRLDPTLLQDKDCVQLLRDCIQESLGERPTKKPAYVGLSEGSLEETPPKGG
ncbi:hypothetical protein HPB52_024235 [Rhipicephalus sanguineus]|uniref:Uncharacterized protein n=1 Tax=Rhipicephalus sanguineus TaxID=34632 RepID=A0A9D4TCN5_RHISA|nr:hypothetical protein HPB52_024235 [Rhipicephalus sanguineus]